MVNTFWEYCGAVLIGFIGYMNKYYPDAEIEDLNF